MRFLCRQVRLLRDEWGIVYVITNVQNDCGGRDHGGLDGGFSYVICLLVLQRIAFRLQELAHDEVNDYWVGIRCYTGIVGADDSWI